MLRSRTYAAITLIVALVVGAVKVVDTVRGHQSYAFYEGCVTGYLRWYPPDVHKDAEQAADVFCGRQEYPK